MDYSKYTILIVDDYPLNILLVKKMLSRFQFNIRTAADGRQALASVREYRPDIILLDLMMPVLDGFGVLRELKADPSLRDIKVVILSALNSEPEITKGMNAGADDFITKPFIMERLCSCINRQLQEIESAI